MMNRMGPSHTAANKPILRSKYQRQNSNLPDSYMIRFHVVHMQLPTTRNCSSERGEG
jgi:hypothetical protein